MCVGRELFNLCKCGCSEADHEQDITALMMGFGNQRGKCNGQTYLPLSIQEIEDAINRGEKPVLTKPCECQKFEPAFKSECGGFGSDDPFTRTI